VGTNQTFTVTTGPSFPAAVTLTETGALPAGLTFTDNHNGTATITGTPAVGTGRNYPVQITASNGAAPDATQNFTLTVTEPPAITSDTATSLTAGVAGNFTVTTQGFPFPALAESGALPEGVS